MIEGSGLAQEACRPLTVCERRGAGSIDSKGSKGLVRRIKAEAPQNYKNADYMGQSSPRFVISSEVEKSLLQPYHQ